MGAGITIEDRESPLLRCGGGGGCLFACGKGGSFPKRYR